MDSDNLDWAIAKFGNNLLVKTNPADVPPYGPYEEQETITVLAEKTLICLYFSGEWCPPCHRFTPNLVSFYNTVRQVHGPNAMEIIFVSRDGYETEFQNYYTNSHPWASMVFNAEKLDELSSEYHITGIPSLVFLDANGNTTEVEGRTVVYQHSQEINGVLTHDVSGFPWIPLPFSAILESLRLVSNASPESSAFTDTVASESYVLFNFQNDDFVHSKLQEILDPVDAMLHNVYESDELEDRSLEIIYCYFGTDQSELDNKFQNKPWKAIPFEYRESAHRLYKHFGKEFVGYVMTKFNGLDADEIFTVVNLNPEQQMSAYSDIQNFPWPKLNVYNLEVYIPFEFGIEPTIVLLDKITDEEKETINSIAASEPEYCFAFDADEDEMINYFRELTYTTDAVDDGFYILLLLPTMEYHRKIFRDIDDDLRSVILSIISDHKDSTLVLAPAGIDIDIDTVDNTLALPPADIDIDIDTVE